MKLTGAAVPLIGGILFARLYSPLVVSENGTLVYATASSSRRYQAVWVDRDGTASVIDPDWGFDPGGAPALSLSAGRDATGREHQGSRRRAPTLEGLSKEVFLTTVRT